MAMQRSGRISGRDEHGAAAVEFALVLPLLIMIVFGIIAFGNIYSQIEVFESAAREGGRVASVEGTSADVVAATQNAATPYTLSNTPAVSQLCTPDTIGQSTTVSWTQQFSIPHPPGHYLRRIWVDNLVYEPAFLAHVIDVIGPSQVLLGTDYPFDMGQENPVDLVEAVPGLSEEDARRIMGGNAIDLLHLR